MRTYLSLFRRVVDKSFDAIPLVVAQLGMLPRSILGFSVNGIYENVRGDL